MLAATEQEGVSPANFFSRPRRQSLFLALPVCVLLFFWTLSGSSSLNSSRRHHDMTTSGFSYTPSTVPTIGQIPRQIYQVFFYNDADESKLAAMESWVHKNPDCSYNRLSPAGALEFVREHYVDRPDLIGLYTDLSTPVLKADILRLMILQAHGGIYADVDVSAVKPLRKWVPKHLRKRAAVIVGIEYDRLGEEERAPGFWLDIQFATWTVASAPGHPLLQRAVDTISKRITALADKQGCSLEDLEPTDDEILQTTGPAVWSQVVFDSLSLAVSRNVTSDDLTHLEEPKLFGDILVLPIDGFCGNVPHSGAGRHPEQALISHGFHGSWRGSGAEDAG